MASPSSTYETGYLDAKNAYDLDQYLFSNGYTLEQLMELAGLAVAEAVFASAPPNLPDSSQAHVLVSNFSIILHLCCHLFVSNVHATISRL